MYLQVYVLSGTFHECEKNMGNLNATESVLQNFKAVVFHRYGKLHGSLRKEVDLALKERAKKINEEHDDRRG